MQTALELWFQFSDMTLPKPCSDLQYQEVRLAFYAGMYSVLCELSQIPDETTEEGSLCQLNELSEEVEQFHIAELQRRRTQPADAPVKEANES